jgi:hypothetical protein
MDVVRDQSVLELNENQERVLTRQLEATRSLETSRGLATLAPTAGSV